MKFVAVPITIVLGSLGFAQVHLLHVPRSFGPMSAKQADAYVRGWAEHRYMVSAATMDRPEDVRKVLVADYSQLGRLVLSRDGALSSEAAFEAGGRRDARLIPALREAIARCLPAAYDAVGALDTIGTAPSLSALRMAVSSRDEDVATWAALALAKRRDSAGKSVLLKGLRKPADNAYLSLYRDKARIGGALVDLGYGASQAELDTLLSHCGAEKRLLLPRLASLHWEVVEPTLIRFATDAKEYQGVRKWAVASLASGKDVGAMAAVDRALHDPVPQVRAVAAMAALCRLGKAKPEEVIRFCKGGLGNPPLMLGHMRPDVADAIAHAMGPDTERWLQLQRSSR